jgi:hypothetical protein
MYRPGVPHGPHHLRTAPPYEARHLPWYQNSDQLSPEDRYYTEHADNRITNWNDERLPANVRGKLRMLRHDTTTGNGQ